VIVAVYLKAHTLALPYVDCRRHSSPTHNRYRISGRKTKGNTLNTYAAGFGFGCWSSVGKSADSGLHKFSICFYIGVDISHCALDELFVLSGRLPVLVLV